jgi:predicted DNA-binding transcriptional regulator AlpA
MNHVAQKATARPVDAPIQPRGLPARKAAAYIGFGYSTLFELRKKDPTFPIPVRLSANRVVYLREELDAWLNAKRAAATVH